MLSELLTDPLVNDGHTEYTPGISQSSAGGQLYYTQDRVGSDVQQENALGGVTFSGQLDAFGNSITHTGNAVGQKRKKRDLDNWRGDSALNNGMRANW